MSFNLITILKSSILSELDLSLNVIFQHYDDLEAQLGYEPSFKQLEDHIFYHSHREEISDYEDYTCPSRSSTPEVEWVFNEVPEKSYEETFNELLEEISNKFPEYKNDIILHRGYHHCSRECEGMIFLCGNSYPNSNGGFTKCGYLTPYFLGVYHECEGDRSTYFSNKNSNSINKSHPKRRNKNSKSSKSWVKNNDF